MKFFRAKRETALRSLETDFEDAKMDR